MSEREKLRDAVVEAARFWEREGLPSEGFASPGEGALVRAVRALDAAERPRFEARCGAVQQVGNISSACDPTLPRLVYIVHDGCLTAEGVAAAINEHYAKEKK